jgi:hypothetical protein
MTRTAVMTRKAANSSQFMTAPNLAHVQCPVAAGDDRVLQASDPR